MKPNRRRRLTHRRTVRARSNPSDSSGNEEVVIRTMRPGDAKSVTELSTSLGYPISARAMRTRIGVVEKRRDQRLFVAELSGTVVGWLEVFRPLSVLNWGKAEIGALVVDDRHRRRGVGASLLRAADGWAQKRRAPFVYLRSNIVRKEAHKFYERLGFNIFKTQYVFKKKSRTRR
jgi:GNAT superfamily N-acetyltransferase